MTSINLPTADGGTEAYEPGEPRAFAYKAEGELPRVAYAAAHVVSNPLADNDPWIDTDIDWEATLNYRRYLWGLGLGVAEASTTFAPSTEARKTAISRAW